MYEHVLFFRRLGEEIEVPLMHMYKDVEKRGAITWFHVKGVRYKVLVPYELLSKVLEIMKERTPVLKAFRSENLKNFYIAYGLTDDFPSLLSQFDYQIFEVSFLKELEYCEKKGKNKKLKVFYPKRYFGILKKKTFNYASIYDVGGKGRYVVVVGKLTSKSGMLNLSIFIPEKYEKVVRVFK